LVVIGIQVMSIVQAQVVSPLIGPSDYWREKEERKKKTKTQEL